MIHLLQHTLIDTLKVVPFLFITFIIIELLEHKYNNKSKLFVKKSGKFGPFIGGLLGIVPQCGFSVMATNLYITRAITLGTLFSIYLSTSDEMIFILVGKNVDISVIMLILCIKLIAGILVGFLIDCFFVKNKKKSLNYNLCDNDNCDCEHGFLKSSLKHTLKIFIFLLIVSLIINMIFEYSNDKFINTLFLNNSIFAPFIGSIIGLIPNCGASVLLTELFLNNIISFSTLIAGLLTGSGVALLVLFKQNKNLKENILIILSLYFIGAFIGMCFEIVKILF